MKTVLLLALSAIILSQSYGFAYGALPIVGEDIVYVTTDSTSYETGETINVSGSVSDYVASDPYKNFDVTLRLLAPNNNIISISQLPLNSDGSYSTSIPAEGPLWKYDGDYTISVSHGSDRNASTTFAFVNSEIDAEAAAAEAEAAEAAAAEAEAAEAEAAEAAAAEAEKCGEGTYLEDGICVLDETVEPTSSSTGSSPTTGFSSWVYSISFTILIAFAIMIILYMISRASKNKTVDD